MAAAVSPTADVARPTAPAAAPYAEDTELRAEAAASCARSRATLVALGAASFVIFASLIPDEASPTRIAAQVVSGIGLVRG